MKYLIIILFTFSLSFAQNQEAKIFFKDGDTFEGFGMITGNNNIKFRLSLDDKPTRFTSDEISRIEFYDFETSATFQYIKLKEKYKLLEVLIEGEVSLYAQVKTNWRLFLEYSNNYYNHNNFTFYLVKKRHNNQNSNKIISLGWKKKMMEYFSDCSELVRKIQSNEFKRDDLQEIVIYYNDFCTDL